MLPLSTLTTANVCQTTSSHIPGVRTLNFTDHIHIVVFHDIAPVVKYVHTNISEKHTVYSPELLVHTIHYVIWVYFKNNVGALCWI